jgi:RsiW-degrading membrane proteinase PrsW (M82 family)
MYNESHPVSSNFEITMSLIIAYLIATVIPLICLWIIYKRNLYSTSQVEIVLLCFGWGLASFYLAAEANTWIMHQARLDIRTISRFVAPVSEEIIKSLLLILLVRRRSFKYFVDGSIYGFAVGIGFAVIENYRYIGNFPTDALTISIGRALSTNLIHATSSAIVGVLLGLARFQRGLPRRVMYFTVGLGIAILTHGGFNNLVSRLGGERWLVYSYAIVIGSSGAAFILWLIQLGLKEERGWINEMLGLADQVTLGESRMVLRLAEAGVLLAPIVERFGKQKATEIGSLLAIQAQLGILRKTAQTLPDERQKQDAEKQITALQSQMAVLRNRIGVYPMIYLRSIFPDENYSVWSRLESATVTTKPVEQADVKDFSLTDLQTLPTEQRRVMQFMLRGTKRASHQEMQAELVQASYGNTITEEELSNALEELVKAGKVARVEDDVYEVSFRRRARLTLQENIWDRLSLLSSEPSSSDTNVWNDLKTLLEEQSKTEKKPQGANLWTTLAQRIPE